jgi:hypothetical protein
MLARSTEPHVDAITLKRPGADYDDLEMKGVATTAQGHHHHHVYREYAALSAQMEIFGGVEKKFANSRLEVN